MTVRTIAFAMREKVSGKVDRFREQIETRLRTMEKIDFSKLHISHDFKSTPDWVRRSIRLVRNAESLSLLWKACSPTINVLVVRDL